MGILNYALAGLLILVAVYAVYRFAGALKAYRAFRGQRLVVCPETREPAAVRLAASELAMDVLAGSPHLRLSDCSRWPERQNCGQDCLGQVEADPERCLVWNLVADWYRGKKCVYCGKEFGTINWLDHRPAVVDTEGRTVQWTELRVEKLPEVFSTHWPACWDCHVAEKFRHEHPELVVDRQRRKSPRPAKPLFRNDRSRGQ